MKYLGMATALLLAFCTLFASCGTVPEEDSPSSLARTQESQTSLEVPLRGPDDTAEAQVSSDAVQAAYDTEGLVVTPVAVEKMADQMSDEEMFVILKTLSSAASDLYSCDIFEVDQENGPEGQEPGTVMGYYPITNFESTEEVIRNFTAIFSYDYFQSVIFPGFFLTPYTVGGNVENDGAVIRDMADGQIYLFLASQSALIPVNIDAEAEKTLQVIYKSGDMFKVRLEYGWPGGSKTPYVVTAINQNGLWVLDNYYSFDILECTHLAR